LLQYEHVLRQLLRGASAPTSAPRSNLKLPALEEAMPIEQRSELPYYFQHQRLHPRADRRKRISNMPMHHLVPNGGRLVAANLAGRGADAGRGRGGRGRGGRGRGGAAQPPTALSVAAAASNAARTIAEQNPVVQDATYTNEQNQFINWVEARREEGYIPPGDKYLTRENVDAYFTMVVVHIT